MTMGNLNPSARAGILAAISPQSAAAGTYTSGWVDMQDVYSLMAIILVGAMTATGTLDAKVQQATDSGGTGAKDVSGTAITQLTAAGTDSNKQVAINVTQADLDRNNGFRFVRLSVTTATAASLLAGMIVGLDFRYGAATDNDAATVDEVVS
jgi:hypothetical protein